MRVFGLLALVLAFACALSLHVSYALAVDTQSEVKHFLLLLYAVSEYRLCVPTLAVARSVQHSSAVLTLSYCLCNATAAVA